MRSSFTQSLLHVFAATALFVLIAVPLGTCLFDLASGGEARQQAAAVFSELGAWTYLLRGLALATGAMLIAGLCGGLLGLLGIPLVRQAFQPAQGRAGWKARATMLALIPLIIPPSVYALAWNALWPTPNTDAMALVRVSIAMGLAFAPLVLIIVLAARSLQDPAAEEAALLAHLSLWQRIFRIRLPHTAGALASGSLAVFLLAFSNFEMPSALGYESFPEAVYQRFWQTYSLSAPAALAIVGASPALILAFICWRALKSHKSRTIQFEPRLPLASARSPITIAAWLIYFIVSIALPFSALLVRIGGQVPLETMRIDVLQGLRDTIPVVFSALAATLLLGWLLADLVLEHKNRTGLEVFMLVLLGIGVAPAVMAIGIIRFWMRLPEGGFVYGTNMAFVLALTGRFLALSTLVLIAARILLPADFIESARLNRVSFINRHVRLLLPVSALTLVALAASLLALIMGELGATTLLSAPGTELISFRLHSRIHLGPESYIAAFSILYAAAVLFLTFLFWLAGNWVLHGRRSA